MAARKALLQTAPTIRSKEGSARASWAAIRESEQVSKALANQSWSTVVRAIKENDARLFQAQEDLALAKERLALLDAQLAAWDYARPDEDSR